MKEHTTLKTKNEGRTIQTIRNFRNSKAIQLLIIGYSKGRGIPYNDCINYGLSNRERQILNILHFEHTKYNKKTALNKVKRILNKPLLSLGLNKRVSFRSHIRKTRKKTMNLLGRKFDMAHRYPYNFMKQDVDNYILVGRKFKNSYLKRILKATTIPVRNFGTLKKGDKTLYSQVKLDIILGNYKAAIEKWNSSSINLRAGDPSKNRSIGGDLDLCVNPDRSPTPQSQLILDVYGKIDFDTSDFMTLSEKKEFEKDCSYEDFN